MNDLAPLPLINSLQAYGWGHPRAMESIFGIGNPERGPQAEIWIGAHPKAPSQVRYDGEKTQALDQFIEARAEAVLGDKVSRYFDRRLPFLLKVLSAAEPLSIQAHPNKAQALEGFSRENAQGIPVDALHRNYRDDNHKPELIYALTPFRAMNGFRPFDEILTLFRQVKNSFLQEWLEDFERDLNSDGLGALYQRLMSLEGSACEELLGDVLITAKSSDDPAFKEVLSLEEFYTGDVGIVSPLLLNLVTLLPGEAMFLKAGTLHAYLEGTGLEIMASSDNVLRGGLTAKHVDTAELMRTIVFEPVRNENLRVEPYCHGSIQDFLVPVPDFTFRIVNLSDTMLECVSKSVEVLFCVSGQVTVLLGNGKSLTLNVGQSCLVSAENSTYTLSGRGKLASASCDIERIE